MNKQNWIEKSHDSWSVFKIMGELVEDMKNYLN